jgi:hypothetical protein
MSAHTPGPWTINKHGKIVSPSGETIVVAGVRYATPSNPPCGNAHLIAAAPDLLVALKKCLNFIENVDANFGTKISAADDARAAIARAEGKQ